MENYGKDELLKIFDALATTMSEERENLIAMDSVVGDGDLGITMDKAFAAGNELIKVELAGDDVDISKAMAKAGMKMASAAPSTMGTLMGSGFMSGAKAIKGCECFGVNELAKFFSAFCEVVMTRGKAKPGEKTIVDVLKPVADKLAELAGGGVGFEQTIATLKVTSESALESTRDMIPQHGKAATFSAKSKGLVDQGAYVVNLIVRCFCSVE